MKKLPGIFTRRRSNNNLCSIFELEINYKTRFFAPVLTCDLFDIFKL